MKTSLSGVLVCAVLVSICARSGESARVLGLFPTFGKSHLIIQMEVIKTLIDRGHNVTVVTSLPLGIKNPNFHHIKLPTTAMPGSFFNQVIEERKGLWDAIMEVPATIDMAFSISETTLINLKKTNLFNEEPFDLIVFGLFINDFFLGVPAHFKSPVVIVDTHKPLVHTNAMIGSPDEIFYVPSGLSPITQPMSFFGRVANTLLHAFEVVITRIYRSRMSAAYEKYFPSDKYPSLNEMYKNVSLILLANHFTEGIIRPEVPSLIQIGGIQAKPKPDPLPEDLSSILDGATEHGVIYFSLGTNAKSSERNPATIKSIYNVLAKLKQTVIWKWENGEYPGNASNIFYKKWLPQDDILAHPNVRLFISHCGLGSVVESKFHGVPVLAIPLFADQFGNANGMVDAGFAVQVDYLKLTEESFEEAVKEVLNNSTYRDKVKAFSKLYRDRPMAIRDTAAYWMEYVIRHRGAKHMQSPAVHMSAIEYFGLDVIGFLLVILFVIFKVLSFCLCTVLCKCVKKGNKKSHKNKND